MLKLLKYDFQKERLPLIITAVAVALVEAVLLIGDSFGNENILNWGLMLFGTSCIVVPFVILALSISVFEIELKKKSGYMTFLTPRSAYQIIGSKLLFSLIVLAVTGIVYVVLLILNITQFGDGGNPEDITFSGIISLLSEFFPAVLQFVVLIMGEWFFIVTAAYSSMAISYTVLGGKKIKNFVTVVIMVVAIVFVNWISQVIYYLPVFASETTGAPTWSGVWVMLGIYFLFSVLFYFITSYLTEKKLSL